MKKQVLQSLLSLAFFASVLAQNNHNNIQQREKGHGNIRGRVSVPDNNSNDKNGVLSPPNNRRVVGGPMRNTPHPNGPTTTSFQPPPGSYSGLSIVDQQQENSLTVVGPAPTNHALSTTTGEDPPLLYPKKKLPETGYSTIAATYGKTKPTTSHSGPTTSSAGEHQPLHLDKTPVKPEYSPATTATFDNKKKPMAPHSAAATSGKKKHTTSHSELALRHHEKVHHKIKNNPNHPNNHEARDRRIMTADIKPHKECLPPAIQYIVTCKDNKEQECHDELADQGVDFVHMIKGTKFFAVCVDSEDDYAPLMALADVDRLDEDKPRRLMKPVAKQEPVVADGQHRHLEQTVPYGVELVHAIEYQSQYGCGGEGVRVCIIDTGLDADHEDLGGHVVDGSNGGDLVFPWDEDGLGHGTHIAGTIAAADNTIGVCGVAPEVDLFIARVFDNDGIFMASSLVDAINECDVGGSNIISMSLGGAFPISSEQAIITSLTNKGVLFVASAGNSGDLDNPIEYPAGYADVMSVAAIDENSDVAYFSSHNAAVDIAAPGVEIESLKSGGGTISMSGTSMSTPHVSAVAALLMSHFPDEPTSRIREAMENSAIDLGPCGKDNVFGHGLVDAMAAAVYLENSGGNVSASTISPQEGCEAGGVPAIVHTTTDAFNEDTSWYILFKPRRYAAPTRIIYRGGPYEMGNTNYTERFYLPTLEQGCYEFRLLDSFGDGTCCDDGQGSHEFIYNDTQLLFEDNFQSNELSVTFGCNGDVEPVCGNGILEAPAEECDDGNTADEDGCSPTCQVGSCGPGEILVDWIFHTDSYASETSWEMFDCNSTINSGSNYGSNQEFRFLNCVPSDVCYTLRLEDSFGDGFCCGPDPSYTLIVNGTVLANETIGSPNLNFGYYVEWQFGDGNCTCDPVCGNGIVEEGEECDDGNIESGDGCSSLCEIEECASGELLVNWQFQTDGFGSETSWELVDRDGNVVDFGPDVGSYFDSNQYYQSLNCVPSDACYTLQVIDTWGDGMCCGVNPSYALIVNGTLIANATALTIPSTDFGYSIQWEFGNCPSICGNGIVEDGEECDDGNTESGDGCSSTCQHEDLGCSSGEMLVDWRFQTDSFGYETSWELVDSGSGITVDFGADYSSNTNYRFQNCVPSDACYTLRLDDAYGDGFCCGLDPGYTLIVDGTVLADESGVGSNINFGSSIEWQFGNCDIIPSSCTGGLVPAQISLETDSNSLWQNELYFFDVDGDEDDFFVWSHPLGYLGNSMVYEGDVCLDPTKCYDLYFFDLSGDGLSTGGLTFSYNGQTSLQIIAGDAGEQWERWSPTRSWTAQVGNCVTGL